MIVENFKLRKVFFLFSLITSIIPKKWPQFLIFKKKKSLLLMGLVYFPCLETKDYQSCPCT